MSTYIENAKVESLEWIIASYGDKVMYHQYELGQSTLGAGQPLTAQTMKQLFKFVNDVAENNQEYKFEGFIPGNVLKYQTDEKYIIWYTEPRTETLIYKEGLPIKTGVYPLPHLLWKLDKNSLAIWALKTRPKKITESLFQAPFFNTYSSGSVCMGSAKLRCTSNKYESIIKSAENAFFTSMFTHTSHNELLNGNFIELSNGMLDKKHFNTELLLKTKTKIKDIL